MESAGARTSLIRAVDHDIAKGVWPDMTEHGWVTDQWPVLYSRIMDADIHRAVRTDLTRRCMSLGRGRLGDRVADFVTSGAAFGLFTQRGETVGGNFGRTNPEPHRHR